MVLGYRMGSCLVALSVITLAFTACASATPPPIPTKAPAPTLAPAPTVPKAAEPTKAAALAQPTAAAPAVAKPTDWPKRPIMLIIPADPGGPTDVGFRLLAPLMEKSLGTPVEIVNKPGAGTQLGVTELANAKPDGYTIGVTLIPQTPTIYLDPERKAAFNRTSFSPIASHVYDPGVIAVAADSKYKTLKDLVEDAKANPEKVKVGTSGVLSDDHLAVLMLQKLTGVKFAIVHFNSFAPQSTALLGQHIDVGFDNVGSYGIQAKKQGSFRILAVMDTERSKFIPDMPTAKEQGYELYSASTRPLSAPKGTPKEIVWALAGAMEQAMKDQAHIDKMAEQGLTLKYMNPDQLEKFWVDFDKQVEPLMSLAREN